MQINLIIGNIFSLLTTICIGISAMEKSKKRFMFWQIGDAFFGMIMNIVLSAYAAMVISVVCLLRNFLSFKGWLTCPLTIGLLIIGTIIGLHMNNLGVIGWLPVLASGIYTICIYITKNEQQMRYALILNMLLWFGHNAYIRAYPSAIANLILCFWTIIQALKNRKTVR